MKIAGLTFSSVQKLSFLLVFVLAHLISSCNSFPKPDFKVVKFPVTEAFINEVKRPFVSMGVVRAKVNFQSLDDEHDERELCQNAFNRATRDMVKMAKEKGAEAVVKVRSVVFYEGGQHEELLTPECADDGMEGQVLTQGIAVKWK